MGADGPRQAAFDAIDAARSMAGSDPELLAVHLAEAVVCAVMHLADVTAGRHAEDERHQPLAALRDRYSTVEVEHTDAGEPKMTEAEVAKADLVVLIHPDGRWTVWKDRFGPQIPAAAHDTLPLRVLAAVYDRKLEEAP